MKWENVNGYTLTKDEAKSTWWKAIYDFQLDHTAPLTLVDNDEIRYRPESHYLTDMGSIPRFPPICQMLVPKDRFLAFYPHDSGYEFGGLYVNRPEWKRIPVVDKAGNLTWDIEFRFQKMTRREVDDILLMGMECDPIPAWRATMEIVYSQVRWFGAGNFNQRTDVPQDKPPAGLNSGKPMPQLKMA